MMEPTLAVQEWGYKDFPHNQWPDALVEVNGEIIVPVSVEFGKASTGQQCLIITFEDMSKLNIWLDANHPHCREHDYAVWTKSPFQGLTLSTCPDWQARRCSRCMVKVEAWEPLDLVVVDLKFCEFDDHRRLPATPHARVEVWSRGVRQRRLTELSYG